MRHKSQTKLSVPVSLRDYTPKQRFLTKAEEPHQAANMRLFTFALASLCRSKALGKLPVDRVYNTDQIITSLSKSSKDVGLCKSFLQPLGLHLL